MQIVNISIRNQICPQKVILMKADLNYTEIHFIDSEIFIIAKTLKEMENCLKNHSFIRPNRSYLINLNHVLKTEEHDNVLEITMRNKQKIVVSRRKKVTINDFINLQFSLGKIFN